MEPRWRPARSFQLRMDHPLTSNLHAAPGSFGNQNREENFEYMKQKTYLEWNPPNTNHTVNAWKYDKVDKYDITKEN